MAWIKELRPSAARDGWKDDFPLAHDLPETVEMDCSRLQLPLHPMFAVRLRIFIEWHRAAGREVQITLPIDSPTRHVFEGMRIDPELPSPQEGDAIMPVTCMTEFLEVEEVAGRTQEILEYQLPDVSPLGQAAFMAMSELCGNAIDHGENDLGAFAAVRRVTEPRRAVSIAIGIGFSAVIEAALTAALHAAKMDILSASGFCRIQTVQQSRKTEVLPASRFRRGTWITYDLVSV